MAHVTPQPDRPAPHAHTRARPRHWIGTAAALAATLALATLLGPAPADGAPAAAPGPNTAGPDTTRTRTTPPGTDGVTWPLDCRGQGHRVLDRADGDLDGDGRPETTALVTCDVGAGTPPQALYVLAHGPAGPRVVATLVAPAERRSVIDLAVRAGTVHATLLGYSRPDLPRCCPDRITPADWRWTGREFRRENDEETPNQKV
ncbi:hypothetical protein ACN20G_22335 [Streptomyces sp. BI20]|uniref:hypothetical protein n=1 Tax=Streptomyces sp. BI20 TaxID=3403460 RepID=UPI003C73F04E